MSATAKRTLRRAEEIHFYEGTNGGGKTYAAVYDTIPTLEAGRPVLSTVRLLDPNRRAASLDEAGEAWEARGVMDWRKHSDWLALPHPNYVRWTRFSQLLDWDWGDVLADEVQGVFSSRSHNTTPSQVVHAMLQLRRADVLFRATAPSFARLDLAIREVTQALTSCRGLMKVPVEGRLWGAARLFLWRTYDARDYDEWDASNTNDNVKHPRSVREWHWRPGHPEVSAYYDTFAPVDTMEEISEAGNCMRCGGSRRRPKCGCDGVESAEHAPLGARAQASRRLAPASDVA